MVVTINKILFAIIIVGYKLDVISGECNNVAPLVSDASSNSTGSPPYPEGTVVKYECNVGFRERNEVTEIVCVNGEWAGKFGCIEIKCGIVEPPDHGVYLKPPNDNIGEQIYFSCLPGFTIVGSSTILCRSDGRWSPSIPPSCERVSCGEFGDVDHASLYQEPIGMMNSYGSTIHVTCDDDYVLDGFSDVKCRTNGEWDKKPKCRIIPCGPHPALKSSCLDEVSLNTDGTVLTITCLPNSVNTSVTERGRGTAFCYEGEWDELSMGCFCDCKVMADFSKIITSNLDSKKFLKHGAELQWKCENGFEKKTNDTFKCLNGKVGVPECILSPTDDTTDDTTDKGPAKNTYIFIGVVVVVVLCFIILCVVIHLVHTGRKTANRTASIKEMIPLLKSSD